MKYTVSSHVHSRPIHDEVVILDSRADAYLGLNGTAAVVWSVLTNGGTPKDAVDALTARFAVPLEIARSDVAAITNDLVERALLNLVSE